MEIRIKKWIEAGEILAKDPTAIVICPACGKGRLLVKDEPISGLDAVDRYLVCDNCGKYSVISRLKITKS